MTNKHPLERFIHIKESEDETKLQIQATLEVKYVANASKTSAEQRRLKDISVLREELEDTAKSRLIDHVTQLVIEGLQKAACSWTSAPFVCRDVNVLILSGIKLEKPLVLLDSKHVELILLPEGGIEVG